MTFIVLDSAGDASRINFTCTGRGAHELAVPDSQPAEASYWLRCPVCGREARLGKRVMNALGDSGLATVDISALPF